ncbi:hypothetical protein ACFVY4_26510 [Streptomyces sp. NPDC058299]|uniref:hypothetical protein n=1 Tax=Streptomyces sp. NPDC058299 TaxID=3346435 RepID=UPI0036E4D432
MNPNAVRPGTRSTRRGSHLTLVSADVPETPADGDDERQRGRHAAPVTRLPVAGSATVRALMALGALLSAVGISFGKAEAVLSHGAHEHPVEAEPMPDPSSQPVLVAADTTTAASAAPAQTAPGYWAPAIKPVESRVYRLSTPIPGTGRHRRSAATAGWGEWNPDAWPHPTGRHRKSGTATPTYRYSSTTQTVISRSAAPLRGATTRT